MTPPDAPRETREGIELISQHSVQVGPVKVTFTVGRLKPRKPLPSKAGRERDEP